jgi:hypothetical protein
MNSAAIFNPGGRLGDQRGVALIVVLWIFIFLFVVAFDFSTSVREEATAAQRFSDETQGYYLALAGFQRGLYDFLQQQSGGAPQLPDPNKRDLFDGGWREENFGAGVFRVRLVDEGGKININRMNEEALRRIFTNLGLDDQRRDILVDSIMDWRDPGRFTPHQRRRERILFDSVAGLQREKWSARQCRRFALGQGDDRGAILWLCAGEPISGAKHAARRAQRYFYRRQSHRPGQSAHGVGGGDPCGDGNPAGKMPEFYRRAQKVVGKNLADLLPLLGIGSGDPPCSCLFLPIRRWSRSNPRENWRTRACRADSKASSASAAPRDTNSCDGWIATLRYRRAKS